MKWNIASEKFSADQIREFGAGECIAREGDESREMYVVVEGIVKVTKASSSGPIELARVERGGFIGEMSLLESLPRSASAFALTAVKVLVIQPGGFLVKIRRDPTFAFEIMQALSQRIRRTNEALLRAIDSGATSADELKRIVHRTEVRENDPPPQSIGSTAGSTVGSTTGPTADSIAGTAVKSNSPRAAR